MAVPPNHPKLDPFSKFQKAMVTTWGCPFQKAPGPRIVDLQVVPEGAWKRWLMMSMYQARSLGPTKILGSQEILYAKERSLSKLHQHSVCVGVFFFPGGVARLSSQDEPNFEIQCSTDADGMHWNVMDLCFLMTFRAPTWV